MTLLTALAGIASALVPLLLAAFKMFEASNQQHTGAMIQTAAAAQASAVTQASIAQAVMSAPRTQGAAVAALRAGTF